MSDHLEQLADAVAIEHWSQPGETQFKDICYRVSSYLCDNPEEAKEFNRILEEKKFVPNSPCWINAGTDMKSLAACYVIDLEDNMSGIMDTAKRMAIIMKEGGGVGVSLSSLRAEGDRVGPEGSKRTASGPISFLKVFDSIVAAVKSAGVRRGAALANLATEHKDIIKFIRCKENQNEINNFNLSVAVSNSFMEDVLSGSTKVYASETQEDGTVKEYTASMLYDLIVDHMWNNGEPGVQFIDNVNNSVKGKYTGRPEFIEYNTGLKVSNPCVTRDTVLITKEGNFPIEELVGKEVQVWNGDGWSKPVVPFSTGTNPIVKVTITTHQHDNSDPDNDADKDITLFCTPYHKFILAHSMQRVKAEDLKGGEELLSPNCPDYAERDYYVSDVEWLGGEAPTYCLTEPDNHAMTLMCDGVPVLTGNCGETFLKPGEACNLGAINLYKFVNPFWKDHSDSKELALKQELAQTVCKAVDCMNYMLDKSVAPLEEINEAVRASRKIGIGVMGLADYLSAKGIVYGSPEAVAETEKIISFITKTAEDYSLSKNYKNATLTLIAPTGTTGLVGGVSQGIEPHFLRCWTRHSLKMGDLLMYPRSLYDYIMSVDDEELTYDEMELINELRSAITNQDFNLFNKLTEKKSSLLKPWITAHEVTPQQHLDMLLAVQRNVHNSVSKTINLPHDCTPADIHDLIIKAWKGGAKGFTCYRDGSRDSQVLKSIVTVDNSAEGSVKYAASATGLTMEEPGQVKRPRPDITIGETVKMKIGCGGLYVTVNQDAEGICEVFTNLGRAGGCPSQSEATSRLISLALRSGVKVSDVIDQLKGIRCMNCMRKGGVVQNDGKTVVFSCPDAIGRTLEKAYKEYSEVERVKQKWMQEHPVRRRSTERLMPSRREALEKWVNTPRMTESYPIEKLYCPECGKRMQMASGCVVCNNCGYSKCG